MSKICRKCDLVQWDFCDECLICGGKLDIATEDDENRAHERVRKENNEAIVREAFKREENVPKCPTCGSTDVIKEHSNASVILSRTFFGPYSSSSWSQFRCNNCGYMW